MCWWANEEHRHRVFTSLHMIERKCFNVNYLCVYLITMPSLPSLIIVDALNAHFHYPLGDYRFLSVPLICEQVHFLPVSLLASYHCLLLGSSFEFFCPLLVVLIHASIDVLLL